MNPKIRWSAVALLLVAGVCFAQSPLPPHLRSRPVQTAAAKPIPVFPASATRQYPVTNVTPVAATTAGCNSCGNGGGYATTGNSGGGCASGNCGSSNGVSGGCANNGPGFVGGCCDYLRPGARGIWNGYCADRGCGFGFGCNSPMLGGCCNKLPIGMYGATPLGCCSAGVGPRHGWECGGCSSGCGKGASSCFAGASRSCGWRMGTGGYACAPTWSGPTCGCDSTAAASAAPAPPHPAAVQDSDTPIEPAGLKSARTLPALQPITYPGLR